jgi:hypothetical protein
VAKGDGFVDGDRVRTDDEKGLSRLRALYEHRDIVIGMNAYGVKILLHFSTSF